MIILSLLGLQCGGTKKTPASKQAAELGVLFNGWFGFDPKTGDCVGGLGSTHWNDGPDTGGVVHTPVLAPGERQAFYCSADPARIKHQINLMEDAGISVLLYSWWGWGDAALDGRIGPHPDKWMNRALTGMLQQLKERKSRIKVAILIEPFTLTQGGVHPAMLQPHQFHSVLEYLYSNFYEPYAEQMFGYDGKPLLATFDPMRMPTSEIVKPTRLGAGDGAIDWWPRSDGVALEVTAPSVPNQAARLSVEERAVHVELGTDTNGNVSTRAAELVELVQQSAAVAPLLGATLLPGVRGDGIVPPAAKVTLSREGDGRDVVHRWSIRLLSSKERTPAFEKEGWNWWLVPQQPLSSTVSSDGVVFLNHRFSEYYLHMARASYLKWNWRDIDPMLDKGIYEQHWQWALDNRERLKLVFVYSWNFYGELAQLEPSTLGPAPPEREYLDRTKKYYRQLQHGETTLHR